MRVPSAVTHETLVYTWPCGCEWHGRFHDFGADGYFDAGDLYLCHTHRVAEAAAMRRQHPKPALRLVWKQGLRDMESCGRVPQVPVLLGGILDTRLVTLPAGFFRLADARGETISSKIEGGDVS